MHIASNETILTKKDILRMQNISILKSCWIVAIFAVAFVLLAFRVRDGQFVFESVFFVVLGAITLPGYFVILKLLMLKQNKLIPLATKYDYDFFDDRVEVQASSGEASERLSAKFADMKGYKATKKYLLLSVDKNITLYVSKAGFAQPEELEKLEKLLALKFDKKSKA